MGEGGTEEGVEPDPPEPGGAAVDPEAGVDGELRRARVVLAVAALDGAEVVDSVEAAVRGGVLGGGVGVVVAAAVAGGASTWLVGVGTGVVLTGTAATGTTEREASDPEPWAGRLPPPPEALDRVLVRGWAMAGREEIGGGGKMLLVRDLSHPETSGR